MQHELTPDHLDILQHVAAHYVFYGPDAEQMLFAINLALDNEIYLDEFSPITELLLEKPDAYVPYLPQIKTAFLALLAYCNVTLPTREEAFKLLLKEKAFLVINFPHTAGSYATAVVELAEKYADTDNSDRPYGIIPFKNKFYEACLNYWCEVYGEEGINKMISDIIVAAKDYARK